MTLEQFVTKATLLVDETGYPARHKDRVVWDTLIAGISNDVVWGKIIKKGPDVTLEQVLEIYSVMYGNVLYFFKIVYRYRVMYTLFN